LHAWAFKLENGENPDNPSIKVKSYSARVTDGVVQVQA
jgi:nitrite reductase/ring-hydroxylating ferredoxin subunit